MQAHQPLQLFNNNEIDKKRWDECIISSPNSLIYARSFYLDNIASNWKALIGKDYEWVLPVTYKKKWQISYLYQPPFTQQLGIFARKGVIIPYQQIIQSLQHHYKFWEINWNYNTKTNAVDSSIIVNTATNFILDLSPNFNKIKEGYHQDLLKNLKRSEKFKLNYVKTEDFKKCIEVYKEHYAQRTPHVTDIDYNNFIRICEHASVNNSLYCRQALDENGNLLAVALLLFDGKRLYNMMNTTTEAGRKTGANHSLLNQVIQEFSGQELIFDFEGSDLPGVKPFYENFGAVNQPYYQIKYNQLPLPLRLFKK